MNIKIEKEYYKENEGQARSQTIQGKTKMTRQRKQRKSRIYLLDKYLVWQISKIAFQVTFLAGSSRLSRWAV